MADILSQSQIDDLLKSIKVQEEAGEPIEAPGQSKEEYKMYDFNSPKKFTKDKLKLLKGIYDNYGRLISVRLNSILRTVCETEIFTVEEQRCIEFNNMLTENDITMIMHVRTPEESNASPVLFHIEQKFMLIMIDRMLGGTGEDIDTDSMYDYTEIEMAVYQRIMKYMLDVTKDAWSNYVDLTIVSEHLEENPGLFQEISLDEPVVIIVINLNINETDGKLTICIPGTLLSDAFASIDKRKTKDELIDEKALTNRELIMSSINESKMQVKAKIDGINLNLDDIYNLQVGDVIDLNKPKDSNIKLYVEEQPWFEGKLGVYNKYTTIQIENRIEGENEEEKVLAE